MSTLTSGKQSKPVPEDPKALIHDIFGLHVVSTRELDGYFDTNYHVTVDTEHWDNPNITEIWPHGYVFKVMNVYESQLHHAGYACPKTILTRDGDIYRREFIVSEEKINDVQAISRKRHMCRLQTYVPGSVLVGSTVTPQFLYDIGEHLAQLHDVFKDIKHPSLDSYQTIWSLDNLPRMKEFTHVLNDTTQKQMVEEILDNFQTDVLSDKNKFSKGIIHGDINGGNILVKSKEQSIDTQDQNPREGLTLQGIIDFGDCLNSLYIYDLGVAVMHLTSLSWKSVGLAAGGHVLSGYLKRRTLSEVELDALRVCVAGRYVQLLVVGDYTLSQDPGNVYAHRPDGCSWEQLTKLWTTPQEQLRKIWQEVINSYHGL